MTSITLSVNKDRIIQQTKLNNLFVCLSSQPKFIMISTKITTSKLVLLVVKVNKIVGVVRMETENHITLCIVNSMAYLFISYVYIQYWFQSYLCRYFCYIIVGRNIVSG